MNNNLKIGRVSRVERNECIVLYDGLEYKANLKGSLRQEDIRIAVGDYVDFLPDINGVSLIYRIHERKSHLSREDNSGHRIGFCKTLIEQGMVSNVDYLFICDSLNNNFNVNRIARYTVLAHSGNVKPVVILTKADLCDNVDYFINELKSITYDVDIHVVSSLKGIGMEELRVYFRDGITIALLGSSGVGKSTLINTIIGSNVMKTSGIREDDAKGRHTTTSRNLFLLPNGVTIIDTPGMRELGIFDCDDAVDDTFSDIAKLECMCKFSNCKHNTEPVCAIKNALNSGELTIERWELFNAFKQESKMSSKGTVGNEDESDTIKENYVLWRLMIDKKYQHNGYGKEAITKALNMMRNDELGVGKAKYCWLSYEPENVVARACYLKMGFKETNEMCGNEIMAIIEL